MTNFLLNMVTIFSNFMIMTTVPLTQHISFQVADSDYITVPDSPDFSGLTPMTAMIYVNANGTTEDFIKGFFTHATSAGDDRSWRITAHPTNGEWLGIFIAESGGPTPMKQYTEVSVFDNDDWHQVAFSFAANDLKLYVDGVLVATPGVVQDDAMTSLFDSASPIRIGSNNGDSGFFTGGVSTAAIWSKVLAESELAAIHAAWNPGPSGSAKKLDIDSGGYVSSADLVYWARLGDGDTIAASGILDSSANANHGSPVNTPTISNF